jgi:prepilin-type N-terminal cleavage/methylation domain-containing protein
MGRNSGPSQGFTLIELLVVMAIISILASMLLPTLGRSKEQARAIQCVNNLRQMAISIKLYADDSGRMPPASIVDPVDGRTKSTRSTLGGFDPIARLSQYFPSAAARPLYDYMRPSQVYRCASDKGQPLLPCIAPPLSPSNWETIGCSYRYNAGALTTIAGGGFRQAPADPRDGMAGKPESWVPQPERFILLHEPAARPYGCPNTAPRWYQWHYNRGRTEFDDPRLAPRQFYSPAAFVDGHAGTYNFSSSLTADPAYPYEPTPNWVWYKTLSGTNSASLGAGPIAMNRAAAVGEASSSPTSCCGGAE